MLIKIMQCLELDIIRATMALSDQRRAFSDAYNNKILAESKIYIELSAKNLPKP